MIEHFAVIDSGTTGTRCTIYDGNFKILGYEYIRNRLISPNPGWIEQDPEELFTNAKMALNLALKKAKLKISDIKNIGITNQRETIVAWNKNTGVPIYNAISWQDSRTAYMSKNLKNDNMNEILRDKTGLIANPYFSAFKIKWLLENNKIEIEKRKEILFGTLDSWLIWKLTNGKFFVSDFSNASRTMMMNLRKINWDNELIDYFKIDSGNLPLIIPSFGDIDIKLSDLGDIYLKAVIGDQQAALIGEGCFDLNDTKITIGTGSFILRNIGKDHNLRRQGILTTLAYGTSKNRAIYALEGSTQISGGVIDWFIKNGILSNHSEGFEIIQRLYRKGWNEDIYFVPAFSGIYAPYWDTTSRGLIIGLSEFTKRESLIMAAYEGIIFQIIDILNSMSNVSKPLKLDGGLSRNYVLMKMLSDYTGKIVEIPETPEMTSFGLALAVNSDEQGINKQIYDENKPSYKSIVPEEIDISRRYDRWKEAVNRSVEWYP